MKKKIIGLLSFGTMLASCFAVGLTMHTTNVTAETTTVYVSANGSDENAGTSAAPYATLDKALSAVADGGTVTVKDIVAINGWAAHNKTVTITGGTLDAATSLDALYINDNVTFENMTISVDPYETAYYKIYANGYKVTVGEGVTFSALVDIYGGGYNATVASTELTLLSGTYRRAFGGGRGGKVTGDTHLYVGGNVNSGIDETDHDGIYYVYGGGQQDAIGGNANITFGENAKATYVFGGSYNSGATLAGGAQLTVTGGKAMSIYGGNCVVDSGSGSTTVITGGTFEQVFGGNSYVGMTGDVDLRVLGGTVTRRIYAGCYNDTEGLFTLSFQTNYHVSGKVCLTLGSGVTLYGSSDLDRGVYARSRYNQDLEDTELIFADETAYDNYVNGTLKLTAQDGTMKNLMSGLSVADEIHYYTYSASDNTITQTCAYHTDLAATATLSLDKSVSLQYNGAEIEPATVTHGADWEYDRLSVSYANNVKIGTATASIAAGAAVVSQTFAIIDVPVVLGGSVRLSAPSGLRFQSKLASEVIETGATFGTLIIPKEVLGESALTHEISAATDIKQTKWATESVKQAHPETYEEGYEYFNAVLTDIPSGHYDKVIVARSYVYANGQYYYSDAMERSIAQVSAYALKDGYTNEILYTYVDKALEGETLVLQGQTTLYEGESYQLTLTGNKGCVAVWSSSNENIVTVDKNGRFTAVGVGKATVTAKIGNKSVQCEIIVKSFWTDNF